MEAVLGMLGPCRMVPTSCSKPSSLTSARCPCPTGWSGWSFAVDDELVDAAEQLSGLGTGEQLTLIGTVPWLAEAGSYRVRARVDPEDLVRSEESEDNNQLVLDMEVLSAGLLATAALSGDGDETLRDLARASEAGSPAQGLVRAANLEGGRASTDARPHRKEDKVATQAWLPATPKPSSTASTCPWTKRTRSVAVAAALGAANARRPRQSNNEDPSRRGPRSLPQ